MKFFISLFLLCTILFPQVTQAAWVSARVEPLHTYDETPKPKCKTDKALLVEKCKLEENKKLKECMNLH